MSTAPIIIIGAGMAGLACALQLQERKVPFLIMERSDGPGGRVRTDLVDGFRLDRGFQIVLSAYPELQAHFDLRMLDLRPFRSGALIRRSGGFWTWPDPFREPWRLLETLASPVGSLRDKLLTAQLAIRSLRADRLTFIMREAETSLRFLQSSGFSEGYIERFLRPFFGGVFLEDRLETSSNLLLFLFRNFLLGRACLPALGMQTLPSRLASRLESERLRFGATVRAIEGSSVRLDGGEVVEGSKVVIATEASACAGLLGEAVPPSNATHCSYWAAPSSPLSTPMLVLNPDRSGPIHNLCVPSDVAPDYAPAGQSLVSVSTQRSQAPTPEETRAALRDWFGAQVDAWRHLRTDSIPEALPRFGAAARPRDSRIADHLYVCGDHTTYPSLNGALGSGRALGLRLAYY